jgi:hypothetical protein
MLSNFSVWFHFFEVFFVSLATLFWRTLRFSDLVAITVIVADFDAKVVAAAVVVAAVVLADAVVQVLIMGLGTFLGLF